MNHILMPLFMIHSTHLYDADKCIWTQVRDVVLYVVPLVQSKEGAT
jgi:hypothetical protein